MSLVPDSVSLLFHTPADAWPQVRAALRPGNRRTKDIDVVVGARTGLGHADIDAAVAHDGKCIEWDFLIHAVEFDRRAAAAVSKGVGYLEGFGAWLADVYGGEHTIKLLRCSATFELSTKDYANKLGLPREWPIPPDLTKTALVYSLAAEDTDGRWSLEVDPANKSIMLGVGCFIEMVPTKGFLEVAREVAVGRASRLVHEVNAQ